MGEGNDDDRGKGAQAKASSRKGGHDIGVQELGRGGALVTQGVRDGSLKCEKKMSGPKGQTKRRKKFQFHQKGREHELPPAPKARGKKYFEIMGFHPADGTPEEIHLKERGKKLGHDSPLGEIT